MNVRSKMGTRLLPFLIIHTYLEFASRRSDFHLTAPSRVGFQVWKTDNGEYVPTLGTTNNQSSKNTAPG